MKRLLYLMHVPWGWIKQRPHFLAEHLAAYYDVRVGVRRTFADDLLVTNTVNAGIEVSVIPMIRLTSYSFFMERLNNRLISRRFAATIASYDVVWVTHPDMYELVRRVLPATTTLVCDCMDDYLAFPLESGKPRLIDRLRHREAQMLARADVVFASSAALRRTISERHALTREIVVVNNGLALGPDGEPLPPPAELDRRLEQARFSLTYVGTISPWLDFELILETVQRFEAVTVFLVGPAETPVPRHERIVHVGPLEHKYVRGVLARSDALFMPFTPCDLVMGVDPVKLYEYVASGKPALAVRYPETEKFADYVHLYGSSGEYCELLAEIVAGKRGAKKPAADCLAFAAANSWEKRTAFVADVLKRSDG